MRANGGCDARSYDLAGIVGAVTLEPHAVVTIARTYMELPVCDEIVALRVRNLCAGVHGSMLIARCRIAASAGEGRLATSPIPRARMSPLQEKLVAA
jgi:hypothetical protein